MRTAPTTADQIRECIEQSETLIRLEQLTIDSLKARLIALNEPEKRPKIGEADRLFCRTKDIDQQTVGIKKE